MDQAYQQCIHPDCGATYGIDEVHLACSACAENGRQSLLDINYNWQRPDVPKSLKAFEHRCVFRMPRNMMHSFHSDHNAVHWKLVVKGDVAVGPDYERNFPVVVHPAANGEVET